MLTVMSMGMLGLYYALDVNLETALLIPSGAAILVYIIGSAAGIRLLRGSILPWLSLAVSLVALPFVGGYVAAAIVTGIAGYRYGRRRVSAGALTD